MDQTFINLLVFCERYKITSNSLLSLIMSMAKNAVGPCLMPWPENTINSDRRVLERNFRGLPVRCIFCRSVVHTIATCASLQKMGSFYDRILTFLALAICPVCCRNYNPRDGHLFTSCRNTYKACTNNGDYGLKCSWLSLMPRHPEFLCYRTYSRCNSYIERAHWTTIARGHATIQDPNVPLHQIRKKEAKLQTIIAQNQMNHDVLTGELMAYCLQAQMVSYPRDEVPGGKGCAPNGVVYREHPFFLPLPDEFVLIHFASQFIGELEEIALFDSLYSLRSSTNNRVIQPFAVNLLCLMQAVHHKGLWSNEAQARMCRLRAICANKTHSPHDWRINEGDHPCARSLDFASKETQTRSLEYEEAVEEEQESPRASASGLLRGGSPQTEAIRKVLKNAELEVSLATQDEMDFNSNSSQDEFLPPPPPNSPVAKKNKGKGPGKAKSAKRRKVQVAKPKMQTRAATRAAIQAERERDMLVKNFEHYFSCLIKNLLLFIGMRLWRPRGSKSNHFQALLEPPVVSWQKEINKDIYFNFCILFSGYQYPSATTQELARSPLIPKREFAPVDQDREGQQLPIGTVAPYQVAPAAPPPLSESTINERDAELAGLRVTIRPAADASHQREVALTTETVTLPSDYYRQQQQQQLPPYPQDQHVAVNQNQPLPPPPPPTPVQSHRATPQVQPSMYPENYQAAWVGLPASTWQAQTQTQAYYQPPQQQVPVQPPVPVQTYAYQNYPQPPMTAPPVPPSYQGNDYYWDPQSNQYRRH